MSFPIYMRVGDGEECEVGIVTVQADDLASDAYAGVATLLREVADEIERRNTAHTDLASAIAEIFRDSPEI